MKYFLLEGDRMPSNDSFNRVFTFTFKGISFDTDEGMGHDTSLAHFLNEKYGNAKIQINAANADDALAQAIDQLSGMSGYCIADADYDMQIS